MCIIWTTWLTKFTKDHVMYIKQCENKIVIVSVSDPHWLYADPDTNPDPAFYKNADPDSGKNWTTFFEGKQNDEFFFI
jgi:hypothetical protein